MLMSRRKKIIIHLVLLSGLSILTIILFFRFSTEDSYITYRYAKNLVDGKGLVYNQGEKFLGMTSPFYALILALFGFLGFDIPSIGGLLSSISLGLSLLLIYLLTLRKGYPSIGLLCGAFILSCPWFLMTFGSETYFQLLMITAAFYFYDQKKYIPTASFCALAFLARPDGIVAAAVILLDYLIAKKRFPLKESFLFIFLCAPFFLFYYFNFNSFLPYTLDAKQAQYASGLWRSFLPGTLNFMRLLVKENMLLASFFPLLIIGGLALLFSGRIWKLITCWVIFHIIGYILLRVSFYHWYSIPLIFLLMLMSAFSVRFITSLPRFFKENRLKKWKAKIFNQEINLSLVRFKEVDAYLKWSYRILSLFLMGIIMVALAGGIKSYYRTFKSLPFPKLQLYTEAGKWVSENTPPQSTVAFIEIGYFGYHARRKIIDLVGLITPGVSDHIRKRDFQWAVMKYKPDYFIYNPEFKGWLEPIIEQQWFKVAYKKIMELNHPGFPFTLMVFKKMLDFDSPPGLATDSLQDESDSVI